MTARLRHQLLDDDRVLVTLVGPTPSFARVPQSEIKRFCWAVLADLDPVATRPFVLPTGAVAGQKTSTAAVYEHRVGVVLTALAGGPKTTPEIGQMLDVRADIGKRSLENMQREGLVKSKRGTRTNAPWVWSITSEGRKRLSEVAE